MNKKQEEKKNEDTRFVIYIFLSICISGIWLSFIISEYFKPIYTPESLRTIVGLTLTFLSIGGFAVFFKIAKGEE